MFHTWKTKNINYFKHFNFRLQVHHPSNRTNFRSKDLNVVPCGGISKSCLESLFRSGSRLIGQEFWLIDFSFFDILSTNLTDVAFDDNIYMFQIEKDKIQLWEVYKIHQSYELVELLKYGFWDLKIGLAVDQRSKYERRTNLKVLRLIIRPGSCFR
jgi:hypothetical protein